MTPETSNTAYLALGSLLHTGTYSMSGLGSKHPVVVALKEMVADPNGIVVRVALAMSSSPSDPSTRMPGSALPDGIARPDNLIGRTSDDSDSDEPEAALENDIEDQGDIGYRKVDVDQRRPALVPSLDVSGSGGSAAMTGRATQEIVPSELRLTIAHEDVPTRKVSAREYRPPTPPRNSVRLGGHRGV